MATNIYEVNLTTNASGDVEEYTDIIPSQVVHAVYVAETAITGNSATLTITGENGGASILAKTGGVTETAYFVKGGVTSNAAAARTGQYSGINVSGRLKLVIASGGNATATKVYIYTVGRSQASPIKQKLTVSLTTNASGVATGYCDPIAGRWLNELSVDHGDTTGASATLTVTDEVTGLEVFKKSSGIVTASYPIPTFPLSTTAAAAISAEFTPFTTSSRLKFETAAAGNAKTMSVDIFVTGAMPIIV